MNLSFIPFMGGGSKRFVELPNSPVGNFLTFGVSADGTKLAIGDNNSFSKIWTSTDSGATWTERTGVTSSKWSSVAMSDDGTKIVAVASDDNLGGSNGLIWTSTNTGASWTARTGPGKQLWTGCAISGDGTKMVACSGGASSGSSSNRYPYTSSDSGASWTARASLGAGFVEGAAISDDGTKVLITRVPGGGYYSLNSGASFTATGIASSFARSCSISGDGTKMLFGRDSVAGGLFSLNSGTTWTAFPAPINNTSTLGTALSDSGAIMYAGTPVSGVYGSVNSGTAWSLVGEAFTAWGVGCSADGAIVYASFAGSGKLRKLT